MSPTSAVRFVLGSAAVAAALVACTFTRSLDYLTAGAAEVDAGEAGVAADASEAREGGVPAETVASGQLGPRHLTQDLSSLYWANADGAIMKVAKTGGAAIKVSSAPAGQPVEWISADPGADGDLWMIAGTTVYRVSKAGGDPVPVESEAPRPYALAVDENYLFVVHYDEDGAELGRLVRFSKTDTTSRTVLSGTEDDPNTVALHGGSVFWCGYENGGFSAILELPRDAGAGATPIVHRPGPNAEVYVDAPEAFAVDDEAIYYKEDDVVFRLLRTQPATRSAVFSPPREASLNAFAFDGTSLYLLDERENGAIVRVSKLGGEIRAVATNQRVPTSVVVDSDHVYFTVQGSGYEPDGAVLRAAK